MFWQRIPTVFNKIFSGCIIGSRKKPTPLLVLKGYFLDIFYVFVFEVV